MVKFKKIRWRNFLATGNAWNEIQLDSVSTTLIVGNNGSGKSTLLDAICYVLFGKPFRDINKPQLINSVNQKNLVVEVEFEIGSREYKVIRGMRPGIFEIYQNDKLLNIDAATKDYQAVLEDQIIKHSYKSFKQIVILGSASFTPFMQLPAGARREIVEELLDIKIFSSMNKVLKDKMSALSVELMNLESTLEIAKKQVLMQKKYIETLTQDKAEKVKEYSSAIAEALKRNKANTKEVAKKQAIIASLQESVGNIGELREAISNYSVEITRVKDQIARLQKDIQFYTLNDNCPSCGQDIAQEHKCTKIESKQEETSKLKDILETHEMAKNDSAEVLLKATAVQEQIAEINSAITHINAEIHANQQFMTSMQEALDKVSNTSGDIDAERVKLQEHAQNVVEHMQRRADINEEKQYQTMAAMLLKDTGIKTKVIKQFLPIINKLVNKYLQAMDLFIHFELDESFNETIKSRHRDEFTYSSFSEGEKQRINLALLFAWRAVASLRNTTNTNLLLFDEVLDGSLDASAVENFLTLVKEIGNKTNIFVITHKQDLFADKFDRVIKVKSVGGYSIMEANE